MNKFKIKQFYIDSTWDWFLFTDRCAICRNDLNEPSIEYSMESLKILPKISDLFFDDSGSVAIGKCNHSYHLDCIEMWLNNNKNCPLCSRNWVYQKIFSLNLSNQ